MTTRDFGVPFDELAIAGSVTSLRTRPCASRYRLDCTVCEILVPSARVRFVVPTAVAVNGAPVTVLPPCMPPKPSSSIPKGPGPKPGPGPCGPRPAGAASGAGVCANAPAARTKAAVKVKTHLAFTFISELSSSLPLFSSVLLGPGIALRILVETDGNRLSILTHQKIHVHPLGGLLRLDGQAKLHERAALQADLYHRFIRGNARHAARELREGNRVVIGRQQHRVGCAFIAGQSLSGERRAALAGRWRGLMPVNPAHSNGYNGGGRQGPAGHGHGTARYPRFAARTQFLLQTHFHASRSRLEKGRLAEQAQIRLDLAPG